MKTKKPEWPKMLVDYYGPQPKEIITLDQARIRFKLDSLQIGWFERGEIVGTTMKGYPNVRSLRRYTLDDAIRDFAPQLLAYLKWALKHVGALSNIDKAAFKKARILVDRLR